MLANGVKVEGEAEGRAEAADAAEPPPLAPEHFCEEHQTLFKRYSRGENAWWSYKTADGK